MKKWYAFDESYGPIHCPLDEEWDGRGPEYVELTDEEAERIRAARREMAECDKLIASRFVDLGEQEPIEALAQMQEDPNDPYVKYAEYADGAD